MHFILNYKDVEKLHLKLLPFYYKKLGISLEGRKHLIDLEMRSLRLDMKIYLDMKGNYYDFKVCQYHISQQNGLGTNYIIDRVTK